MRPIFQFVRDSSMPEFYAYLVGVARAQRQDWLDGARDALRAGHVEIARVRVECGRNAHRRMMSALAQYRARRAA